MEDGHIESCSCTCKAEEDGECCEQGASSTCPMEKRLANIKADFNQFLGVKFLGTDCFGRRCCQNAGIS